jgi:DNA-binding CsgD family transcriptional regulator
MPATDPARTAARRPAVHVVAGSDEAVLTALIGSLGSIDFPRDALAALNEPVQAASWSVYRVWRDRAPELYLSASRGVADTTRSCFAAYRDEGLYRHDRSFDLVGRASAQSGRVGGAMVLHMCAADAPSAEHRERIYSRHGLAERLSVASSDDDGSLLAVNLYHHEHQGEFSGRERDRFARIAPLLMASVRRHLALVAPVAAAPAERSPRERLQAACPALTDRELDVCVRLLRGWSHDGVAADLGLSVATVKTYRTRAFGRLGLHFRSELFARFGSAGSSEHDACHLDRAA